MAEVLLAEAALGFTMALIMCLMTLALSGALTAEPLTLLVTLSVSLVICNEIGLIYGTTAKDGKTLYNMAQTPTLDLFQRRNKLPDGGVARLRALRETSIENAL